MTAPTEDPLIRNETVFIARLLWACLRFTLSRDRPRKQRIVFLVCALNGTSAGPKRFAGPWKIISAERG